MPSIDRRCHRHHATPGPSLTLRRPSSEIPPPTPAETHTPKSPKLLPFLLQALIMVLIVSLFFVFVGVAVIIFLHLCLVGGALHRRRIRRSRHHPDHPESRPGLSPAQIRTLPRTKLGAESESQNMSNHVCAICLDNCSGGNWCRQLPGCNHLFHVNCVDRWLAKSPVCPICRTTVSLRRKDAETAETGYCGSQLWDIFG